MGQEPRRRIRFGTKRCKAKVREDLESERRLKSDHMLRDELIRKLLDAHQFEVPESLVEQQTNHRLEGVVRDR